MSGVDEHVIFEQDNELDEQLPIMVNGTSWQPTQPATQSVGRYNGIAFQPEGEVDINGGLPNFNIPVSQEETRAKIALYFTFIFLFLISVALFLPFVANAMSPGAFVDPIESAKNLVTILASVLAGPFGFIVGFYFKQENNNG